MAFDIRVRGDRETIDAFRRLGKVGQAANLTKAVEAGSEPIIRDAKGRAPQRRIAAGIQLIQVEVNARGRVTGLIGLPGGRKPWFHGLLYELGTGPRVQKNGRRTGSMPANPFLRPAFDTQRKAAQGAFAAEVRRQLAVVARG